MPKSKRHIHALAEETLTPPDNLSEGQKIARVKSAAGNSLYHLDLPSGETLLAELPAKFRNAIFIKRGSYVLVDTTSSLADRDNKLGGVISNIVRDERAWRKASFWPQEFAATRPTYQPDSDDEDQAPRELPPSEDED